MPQPTFISFFSGILGLDLGLERAGWEALLATDWDRRACETIRGNRPELPLHQGDIRDLTLDQVTEMLQGETPQLVVGGPPCQAFSTAGRRRGLSDERGNVFLHFLDLAIGLGPQQIVIENVRGLLSCPLLHTPHKDRTGDQPTDAAPGGALRQILQQLESAGYHTTFGLYDTALFGVPQRRERLVILADKSRSLPPIGRTHEQPITLREALHGVPKSFSLPLRPKQLACLPLLGPGENWRNLPKEVLAEAMGGALFAGGGKVGFYRRLAWDQPSPTLVTNPTMPATLLAHPDELRPLSLAEYKRIQTFPDEWQIAGSLTDQYRLVGNAVPVTFGEAIGRHLLGLGSQKAPGYSRYKTSSDKEWREKMAG